MTVDHPPAAEKSETSRAVSLRGEAPAVVRREAGEVGQPPLTSGGSVTLLCAFKIKKKHLLKTPKQLV